MPACVAHSKQVIHKIKVIKTDQVATFVDCVLFKEIMTFKFKNQISKLDQ